MIETRSLGRVYRNRNSAGQVVALDDFTLNITEGEVHGLLGPNGAGKTTLVKILATAVLPTSGNARVCGHDVMAEPGAVRALVGIVFGGERGLYTRLSARENLYFWGAVARLSRGAARRRTTELLGRLGLADRADDPVERYSRGMKQRLHLARGLIGDPPVLVLDEPTVGMDPVATRDFRALVADLRGAGKTILLTTHDMAEAEQLCDRVSLIDKGTLRFTEDPRRIGVFLDRHDAVEFETDDEQLVTALSGHDFVVAVEQTAPGRWRATGRGAVDPLLRWLVDRGVTRLRTERPTLEQVYLHFVGDRGLRL
ncbi:ABC transporter ATP-binding protein [Actinosynnema sp. NPDC050436]|uniref:ABC transporter ATP-binding protein n=1 Tax=Actinosynnema sp. NPDC050436 TaxID=3155659 RepID=UPI0033CEACE1